MELIQHHPASWIFSCTGACIVIHEMAVKLNVHPLIAHARLLTMFNTHEARHTEYAFRASKEIECLKRHEVTMLDFRSLHKNGVIMDAVHTTTAWEALCSSLL